MSYTASAGTATEAMAGIGGDRGAKTGSAEVDGQKKPNGWFTAYSGDLAAAAVVQAGWPRRFDGGPDRGVAAEGGRLRPALRTARAVSEVPAGPSSRG